MNIPQMNNLVFPIIITLLKLGSFGSDISKVCIFLKLNLEFKTALFSCNTSSFLKLKPLRMFFERTRIKAPFDRDNLGKNFIFM